MGSVGVVVNSPFFNQSFGRWQIGKEALVEALITQSPIEAFNKATFSNSFTPSRQQMIDFQKETLRHPYFKFPTF